MSRGLTAATVTTYAAAHVRPLLFAELQFDAGTERVHNGLGTITWGGNTWTGIGEIAEIGVIEEGDELSPYSVGMRLNALNATLLSNALAEDIFERRVILYAGTIDDDGSLTADPDEYWSGWMHTMETRLGQENSLILTCESEHAFLGSANGSLFTDEDQQTRFSGDVLFEFLDQVEDAVVHWGPGGVVVGPAPPPFDPTPSDRRER